MQEADVLKFINIQLSTPQPPFTENIDALGKALNYCHFCLRARV